MHLVGPGDTYSMFQTNVIPVDGNGIPATTYMNDLGGYDLTDLLNWNGKI